MYTSKGEPLLEIPPPPPPHWTSVPILFQASLTRQTLECEIYMYMYACMGVCDMHGYMYMYVELYSVPCHVGIEDSGWGPMLLARQALAETATTVTTHERLEKKYK